MKLSPRISPFDATGTLEGSVLTAPLPRARPRFRRLLRSYRNLLLFVVLPMVVASAYYLLIAAPQYQSETTFVVRSYSGNANKAAGLGSMLAGAGFSSSSEDSTAVRDFLESRDALDELRSKVNVVEIWRRPEADWDPVARLWYSDPPAETLLKYYNRMVTPSLDSTSGTVTLSVKAFRPEDAQLIAETLLEEAEALVNRLGTRGRENTLEVARNEVTRAEQRVVSSREALTSFRVRERAVDPTTEARNSLQIVGQLESSLSEARAEYAEKSAYLRPDNPLLRNVQNRISALESQVATERQRMTGGQVPGQGPGQASAQAGGGQAPLAIPQQLASYERLMLESTFADRQLASATASLEAARVDALRQQLFLARITQPLVAEKAEYPRAGFILGSLFAVLLVAYAMGWLVSAGVKEHAS
ncbi:capsule biosynthesis protein [Roseomonas elaeocarpi]|uniref:Capsule biosynthesis protein n=1 Tax=Roseomonas elaeocarpi TaxID=907779 RepID=A0ABV6JYD9_9PROT